MKLPHSKRNTVTNNCPQIPINSNAIATNGELVSELQHREEEALTTAPTPDDQL
jgi:hypothetical protein